MLYNIKKNNRKKQSPQKNPQILKNGNKQLQQSIPNNKKLQKSICTTIIPLFILLLIQLILGIVLLIIKIVVDETGFHLREHDVQNISKCLNSPYNSSTNLNISFSVSIVMISLCIILTLISHIFSLIQLIRYNKLISLNRFRNKNIMSIKICRFYYVLQSLCVLSGGVVFGYHVLFFILGKKSCEGKSFFVLFVIAAILFAVLVIVWLMIAVITCSNKQPISQKQKAYQAINRTQSHGQDQLNQFMTLNNMRSAENENEKGNNFQPANQMTKEQAMLSFSGQDNNKFESNSAIIQSSPPQKTNSSQYLSQNKSAIVRRYDEDRNRLKGKQYELVSIKQKNPQINRGNNSSNIPGDDEYLMGLTRHKMNQKQQYTNQRKILPLSHNNSKKYQIQPFYNGGNKVKQHSEYFKDQTALYNKSKHQDKYKKNFGKINFVK